jgi:hypothetical protein
MILVDANLLIYAVNGDAPLHEPARRWWETELSGTTRVGLAWPVLLAFLRITTRRGILEQPLDADAALEYVSSWLAQPFVETIAPGPGHWPIFRTLVHATGTAGNLTTDAHLAALAIEHDCELFSSDYDFRRFPGLRHVNPLSAED